jgi:hypothetical protein
VQTVRAFLLLCLFACRVDRPDSDGDGVFDDEDCDAHDPSVGIGVVSYTDLDGDGYGAEPSQYTCTVPEGSLETAGDCDAEDPTVHPGAVETCDAVDEDCDGAIDEDPDDARDWYGDGDGDGYGAGEPLSACDAPEGGVLNDDDCDDTTADVAPNEAELCNGDDDDCDGAVDEDATDALEWYYDADEDGFGSAESVAYACTQPDGWLADDGDCDDTNAAAFPGGQEVCGGGDEDCDGWVDDDDALATAPTWYADADGDGSGNARVPWIACEAPTGFVATADDCNDADADAYVGGTETCDGVDEDCDGAVDEDATDAGLWYLDLDGDDYGDPATMWLDCDEPADGIADGTDCDDTEELINPAAVELCGAGDEDCNGLEGDDDPGVTDPVAWYFDVDGDAYGDPATEVIACDEPGYIEDGGDCDETSVDIHPEAVETCEDGIDQDCWGGDQSCSVTGEWGLASSETVMTGDGAMGGSVAFADVDGDGLSDALLGASRYNGSGGLESGAILIVSPVPDGETDVTTTAAIYEGLAANDHAGIAVVGIGDMDGDGYEDVAVGANEVAPSTRGAVYVLSGAGITGASTTSLTAAVATFPGENDGDTTGETLANAGDIDGDGVTDWLIGCPDDSTGPYHAGSFVVIPGAAWSGTQTVANFVRTRGDQAGQHVAGSIDGAGDFDGDGLDDLVVGAEADTTFGVHAGLAAVILGPASAEGDLLDVSYLQVGGEDPLDEAGTSVAGAGDMDGDGYADIIVGAPRNQRGGYDTGTAYTVRGPVSGSTRLSAADGILIGVTAGGLTGTAVAGLGDVDGDGFDDVAIGVPRDTSLGYNTGAVYVMYGPATGTLQLTSSDGHLVGSGGAGAAIAGEGDVDGDGLMDLLIGGPLRSNGTAWVVRGTVR